MTCLWPSVYITTFKIKLALNIWNIKFESFKFGLNCFTSLSEHVNLPANGKPKQGITSGLWSTNLKQWQRWVQNLAGIIYDELINCFLRVRVLWIYLLCWGLLAEVAPGVLFWKENFTIRYLTTSAGEVLILRLWQVQKQTWTSTLPSLGLKGLIKKSRWIYSLWACKWIQGFKKRKEWAKEKLCKKNKKLDGRNERFKPCVKNYSLHIPPTCPVNDRALTQFLRQSAVPDFELCYRSLSFCFYSLILEFGLKTGKNSSNPSGELVQG